MYDPVRKNRIIKHFPRTQACLVVHRAVAAARLPKWTPLHRGRVSHNAKALPFL